MVHLALSDLTSPRAQSHSAKSVGLGSFEMSVLYAGSSPRCGVPSSGSPTGHASDGSRHVTPWISESANAASTSHSQKQYYVHVCMQYLLSTATFLFFNKNSIVILYIACNTSHSNIIPQYNYTTCSVLTWTHKLTQCSSPSSYLLPLFPAPGPADGPSCQLQCGCQLCRLCLQLRNHVLPRLTSEVSLHSTPVVVSHLSLPPSPFSAHPSSSSHSPCQYTHSHPSS